jgi:release factor glutamine methyltransferase
MFATPPVDPQDVESLVRRLRSAGCVFAEDEAELLMSSARDEIELASLVERRVAGIPIEHLVGWVQFRGLRISLDPGVFVPRRRTELLAADSVALASAVERPVVVELCCGSGAVGAALLAGVDGVELHAVDIDPVAVGCANRNLGRAAGIYEGDLYAALPPALRGQVDVVVANAPYVPTDAIAAMPPEARVHEATVALDGGPDGLNVLRRVIIESADWLRPHGAVLFEVSAGQVAPILRTLTRSGFAPRVSTSEELEATVVIGVRD